MALASSGVNVTMLPEPKLTPPLAAAPGMIKRLLAPILSMVFFTAVLVPWPISVMAMTAATPMTMPSVVNAERMTLRPKACKAIRQVFQRYLMTNALARYQSMDGSKAETMGADSSAESPAAKA